MQIHSFLRRKTVPERAACVAARFVPRVAPTPEDEEALSTIRAIMGLVQAGGLPLPDATAGRRASILVRELAPLVPELMPGVLYTGAQPAVDARVDPNRRI